MISAVACWWCFLMMNVLLDFYDTIVSVDNYCWLPFFTSVVKNYLSLCCNSTITMLFIITDVLVYSVARNLILFQWCCLSLITSTEYQIWLWQIPLFFRHFPPADYWYQCFFFLLILLLIYPSNYHQWFFCTNFSW